ncbi:MAG: hypothetical protein E7058_04180 [Lentisphaerae bacterium]|nr:hypothetical protein [Lentisphaerota bacterium]
MKKKAVFASAPLVLCAAAVMVCMTSSLHARSVTEQHEKISEKGYEEQEKAVARSRNFAKDGKYDQAIRTLQDEVVAPLELEAGEIDSWKARKRLAQYRQELRNLQLTYGNLKLKAAENAIVQGRFNEAIALANEARLITPLLNEKAENVISSASGKKKVSDRTAKTSAETSDPEIIEREAKIKRLLDEARVCFRNGRYDLVWKKVEEVYVLNPYNAEASYLASQAYKKYYQTGYQRRRADIQAQFAYEAWQWVEPVFPVKSENMSSSEEDKPAPEVNDYAIQKKLDEIVLPVVTFNKQDIETVIQFLREQSARWDKDGKKGVNIAFIQEARKKTPAVNESAAAAPENAEKTANAENPENPAGDGNDDEFDWNSEESDAAAAEGKDKNAQKENGIFVTLSLQNVSLRQVLNYVSYLTDLPYVVREDRILFGTPDNELTTRKYELFNSVKAMIAGQKSNAGADAAADAGADAAADAGDMGEGGDADAGEGGDAGAAEGAAAAPAAPAAPAAIDESAITSDALKNFFEIYGVYFPKGSSISYFRGEVQMRNTAENHRHMQEILKGLNVEAPMIEVEVKSIELTENDMEELGFTWALGVIKNNKVTVQKGSNTSVDGEGAVLKMLDGLLSGVDSRIVSNLNIFPDIFGSFKPFGIDESFNLTLTINALDRSDRTEQISAPRVLVANGVSARVKMTKAYFFPEDWEELEIETEEVGDNGNLSVNITPPSPEFSETEEDIGTVFTVTPTIREGNKVINLKLNPKITAYTGKDEAEVVVVEERRDEIGSEWVQTIHRYTVWRPVIATREVTVDVDLNHGETMVIAGLSDSTSQKRMDRIPILSDIPFIGRLFQTQSELSTRRNMLIFVTARLVNNDGIPLPRTESLGNGGIPMLSR